MTRPDSAGPRFATYRAHLRLDDRTHSFRLLLWAEQPDRMHAEVLGPVGGPRVLLDAGGGRIAVTFPGDGLAFAGADDSGVLGRVLGVALSVHDVVAVLLDPGAPDPPGVDVRRSPAEPGLPRRLDLSAADRSLTLERSGRLAPAAAGAHLGTGDPPPGIEVRPIQDLPETFREEGE